MGKLYRMPRSHSLLWLRILPLLGIFVFTLLAVYTMSFMDSAQALSLRQGSTGEEVKELQQELQRQGFYSGDIDGLYGVNTIRAVRIMQQHYGLPVDGLAGTQTLQALGLASEPAEEAQVASTTISGSGGAPSSALTPDELTLLARAIQAEAGDDPYIGKVALGAVLLNRVGHVDFPNTLAGVVYQALALDSASSGRLNMPCGEESLRAAQDAATGWDPSYGSLYFWNPAQHGDAWLWTREPTISYGNHNFSI